MQFLRVNKDGGQESNAHAYWLIEIKCLFSIALIKFSGKSRECFHNHAFNSISWLLRGGLKEEFLDTSKPANIYRPSFIPIFTKRVTLHKVSSVGDSWAITFRGPWSKTWLEHNEEEGTYALKSGRQRAQI